MSARRMILAAGLLAGTLAACTTANATPSYSQAWAQCRTAHTYGQCVQITADAVAAGTVRAPVIVDGQWR